MKHTFFPLLFLLLAAPSFAQVVRDDFNRGATTDIGGSARWRKVAGLSHSSASIQINADSTVSPYNVLGPYERGAVYWDSTLSGRFLVGMILRHKSGSHNIPTFHIHLMNDSNWLTGDGYALRFQENSGLDRFDIQRLTGSGADTPFVSLLATFNREFHEGDTLMFKFYQDGTKTAVRYGADGTRDSLSVVDLFYNPTAWYAWIQGRVFPDRTRWDDFMLGPIPYRITASAGPGGAVSPGGNVHVNPGADASFAITPDPGYQISNVIVDGVPLGPATGYTFSGVASDHTIAALFQAQSYTITASAGPNGTITPSGQVSVGHGGNRSFSISPDPGYRVDSVVVDGVGTDSTVGYTLYGVTTDHTIHATFIDGLVTTGTYPVMQKWNMVSVPLRVPDFARPALFPEASGSAYAYSEGYVAQETLSNGRAYWLKFPAADSVSMTGYALGRDTIGVAEGWNMIGSISVPVPVAEVISIPGGLVSSEFFAYEGAYLASQAIEPGRGYWVKLAAPGELVLGAGPGASPSAAVRIVPAPDLPPSPPGTGAGTRLDPVPAAFSLGQNYPNPFNPATRIDFVIPADAHVRLSVYNILGVEVVRILDGMETAGLKSIDFDAGGLPTGVYAYRIVAGEHTATRRMLILR